MKRIVACIVIVSAGICPAKSNKCCGIPQIQIGINNLQNIQSRILDLVNTIIEDLPSTACGATPITAATTISTPGNYCFANNITGSIAINSPNVSLNLNGFTLSGDINISASSVTIYNGTINGQSIASDGILAIGSLSDIHIFNMNIYNSLNGIGSGGGGTNFVISNVASSSNTIDGAAFLNHTNLIINDSVFMSNQVDGLRIRNSNGVLIYNCSFITNTSRGFFDQSNNTNVIIKDSAAYQNNHGFSLSSSSIILSNCQAESNISEGFQLVGSPTLFNCTASANATGFNIAASSFWLEDCVSNNNGVGFDQTLTSGTIGTCKSCSATNNTGCGFNDAGNAGATVAQYVANYASQNNGGASNYCLGGVANNAPYGPAVVYNTAGASSWINVFA